MNTTLSDSVSPPLPTIADRPHGAVVIYDGRCPFCCAQAARLARWDGRKRLAFLSAQDPLASQRCPDLSPEQLAAQMYVVDRRGRRHGGAAAIRYLCRRLPRLWPLVPLIYLPGTLPLWQAIYRAVAARRYRLANGAGCETGACRIHR